MWLSIKMSLRQLFRNEPGVLFAFGAMAAAVALNAGAHSLIYSVLLQPLPYESAGRLAVVRHDMNAQEGRFRYLSYKQLASLRERSTRWEHLEGFRSVGLRLQGDGIVESVRGEMVSSEFFSFLGVLPRIGRAFTPQDVLRGERVAVISDSFYESHLGGRDDILQTQIALNGEQYAVIGVLPSGFRSHQRYAPDIYLPFELPPPAAAAKTSVKVWGRLASGTTVAQAQSEARAIAAQWEGRFEDTSVGVHLLHDVSFSQYGQQLWMLVIAALLILVLSAFNLGALLLGSEIKRRHQTQIQVALGASHRAVALRGLTANLALALGAGAVGVVLAALFLPLLSQAVPSTLPRADQLDITFQTLLSALGCGLAAGLVAGLFPVLSSFRGGSVFVGSVRGNQLSKRESRSFHALMGAEIALALTLCMGAALLVTSFLRVLSTSPGFQPDKLHSLTVKFPRREFAEERSRAAALDRLTSALRQLPEVEAASISLSLPFSDVTMMTEYSLGSEPESGKAPQAVSNAVGGDFFQVMDIPILDGRDFSLEEHRGVHPVAIVSKSIAQNLWPDTSAVGRWLMVKFYDGPRRMLVVGVADDVRQQDLVSGVQDVIYVPYVQNPQFYATLLLKSVQSRPLDPQALKRTIGAAAPGLRWSGSESLLGRIRESYSERGFLSLLVTVFALTGLVISMAGLYSTVRFSVQCRMTEWGVRTALGASAADLLKQILGRTGIVVAVGLVAGSLLSFNLAGYLRSWLFELEPTNLVVLISVSALILLTSLIASLVPARKALHLDVLQVINSD